MVSLDRAVPFSNQFRIIAKVERELSGLAVRQYGISATNLRDERGFAPPINTPEAAFIIIEEAKKLYEVDVGVFETGYELIQYYTDLVNRPPAIIYIEDELDEQDYSSDSNATWHSAVGSSSSAMTCTRPAWRQFTRGRGEVMPRAAASGERDRDDSGRRTEPHGQPPVRRHVQYRHRGPGGCDRGTVDPEVPRLLQIWMRCVRAGARADLQIPC
jgi:hypothetical protein